MSGIFVICAAVGGLSFDKDGDDLAVIIGTLGALFGGILTYAGLKIVCNLVFGPEKEK